MRHEYKVMGLFIFPCFGVELNHLRLQLGDIGAEWDYMEAKS